MKKSCFVLGSVLLGIVVLPDFSHGAFGDIPCYECHDGTACSGPNNECGSCHAIPPATGAHLVHFGSATETTVYGDTRVTGDFSSFSSTNIIGCGNCHPLDRNSHGNGTWGDIELYNAAAPAGSIKIRNVSASYDSATKTCSNVYCHSANRWTTDGPVPEPWPGGAASPLPDNIITERVYQSVSWEGGGLGCNGCHTNSPTTTSVDNDGGAGDSHNWIDQYGYNNFHIWNMSWDPIGCRTCHNETVKDPSPWSQDPVTSQRTYGDVPIYNKAKHVNGTVDVAFDTVNGFTYDTSSGSYTYLLHNATYDPTTRICSNVGCHNGNGKVEDQVIWGTPYRWWNTVECDRCHGYY